MSTDNPITYDPDRVLTDAQKEINDDTRYWDWFDAWWAQDFSWDGLAKRKIKGWKDGRTLQDYWREEEDRLIDFAGRTWTRFHLPPHDPSGEETSEKFGFEEETWDEPKWQNWHAAIVNKLDDASIYMRSSSDERAQLTGICFPNYFDLSADPPEDETEEQRKERARHIRADWAQFGNYTHFIFAQFGDWAKFSHAQFGDWAIFRHAQFSLGADFTHAKFGDWASFVDTLLSNGASFDHARFGFRPSFDHARFEDVSHFDHARFGRFAHFDDAQFGKEISFEHAQFQGDSFFSAPDMKQDKTVYGLSFKSAQFHGIADFSDKAFPKITSFAGAHFHALAKFQGCTFHQDTSFADAVFEIPNKKLGLLKDFWLSRAGKVDTELDGYQRAFQTLRLHMESLKQYGQEMKFAKLEMQARERRFGAKDTPFWVRALSRAYGLFADYGQSAVRPLFWLGALFAFTACAYGQIAGDDATLDGAVGTAFQSSLPPVSYAISQFYADNTDILFQNALYEHPFLTRLVMVSHGVISLALVFFLLLALKRRFQIR